MSGTPKIKVASTWYFCSEWLPSIIVIIIVMNFIIIITIIIIIIIIIIVITIIIKATDGVSINIDDV